MNPERLLLTELVAVGAIVGLALLPTARAVHSAELTQRETQLREALAEGDTSSQRELACFLFQTSGSSASRAREAFKLMLSAATGGDSEAILHVSKYFRAGFGVANDPKAADTYLASLYSQRYRAMPVHLTSLEQVQSLLERSDCGPPDPVGAALVSTLHQELGPQFLTLDRDPPQRVVPPQGTVDLPPLPKLKP